MGLKTRNDYDSFLALLGGYLLVDEDINSEDSDIRYAGYMNRHGEWYIREEDVSPDGDADATTLRYVRGESGYDIAWQAREDHTYNYPDVAFLT